MSDAEQHPVENGRRRTRRCRPVHAVKFWWKTRHWDRDHGPGCPARYRHDDCLRIELWCDAAVERGASGEQP